MLLKKSFTLWHSSQRRLRTTAIRTFLKQTLCSPRMGSLFRVILMSMHTETAEIETWWSDRQTTFQLYINHIARVHNISIERKRVSNILYMVQTHCIKYRINTFWCQLDKRSCKQALLLFIEAKFQRTWFLQYLKKVCWWNTSILDSSTTIE